MAGAGSQQSGFGHAVTFARLQCVTGLQGVGVAAEHIGVVANFIAHRVVQIDRLLTRVTTGPAKLFCELHQRRVVTIDEAAGLEVFTHQGFSMTETQSNDAAPANVTTIRPSSPLLSPSMTTTLVMVRNNALSSWRILHARSLVTRPAA